MSTLINATLAAIVYLVYIGSKPRKTDTVLDTKIVWNGFGDKQPVPAEKASVLISAHPDVWVTEEEFNRGVAAGKYKDPNLLPKPKTQAQAPDDIDLDDMSGGEGEDDDEKTGGATESEGDSVVIEKIKAYILSIDTDNKKPKIDTLRAALPDLKITAADLTKAWKELGAPDGDIEV